MYYAWAEGRNIITPGTVCRAPSPIASSFLSILSNILSPPSHPLCLTSPRTESCFYCYSTNITILLTTPNTTFPEHCDTEQTTRTPLFTHKHTYTHIHTWQHSWQHTDDFSLSRSSSTLCWATFDLHHLILNEKFNLRRETSVALGANDAVLINFKLSNYKSELESSPDKKSTPENTAPDVQFL